jgi:hypothetical protein
MRTNCEMASMTKMKGRILEGVPLGIQPLK